MAPSDAHPFDRRRMPINHSVAFCILLLASAWVALVNGQPLFSVDTTAYIRGADFAAVYFLGPKFATSWTQGRTLQGVEQHQPQNVLGKISGGELSLNSPFDKAVMAGRSIYYGGLLYLGHITSKFWLAVFTQAAIFLYLSHTLTIKCLRLSFFSFVCVTAVTLLASPLSFFISFLMPDVFAGFLILGVIILIWYWDALKIRDKIIVSSIILYSALTHTSHLLLLICTVFIFALISFFAGRNFNSHKSLHNSLGVLFALALAGIFGELAFSYAVRHTIGVDPIRPPFLMARMIDDGPGYRFLQKNCAEKTYTVCKYIDRLPVSDGDFLWSANPTNGVFRVVDLATRKALSAEQASFAFDVFLFDPVGVTTSATRDFVRQFFRIALDPFFLDQGMLKHFAATLPTFYFDEMMRSHIAMHEQILRILSTVYASTYFASIFGLLLVTISLYWPKLRRKPYILSQREWGPILTFVGLAMVSNAAICGILSAPAARYQTRISWIPLFILGLIAAKYWEPQTAELR